MKLAISQMGWEATDSQAVLELLKNQRLEYFETLPSQLEATRQTWSQLGLQPIAMQALLYGQPEWSIFDDTQIQILTHLEKVIAAAQNYGVINFVFGSPKNRRLPDDLTLSQGIEKALSFFSQLGELAKNYQTYICLEPVPESYGCNFLTNTTETIALLRKLNHPHVRLNLDTGAMQLNQESPEETILDAQEYIQHVHLSEPNLLPVTADSEFHHQVAAALRQIKYTHICSIEQKISSPLSEKNTQTIIEVLSKVKKTYESS